MRIFLLAFTIAGAINFFIFFCGAVAHGGDAINGKSENGHYYLGMHGRYTEVSKDQFNKSKIHAYSVIVTWPFVMLCGYLYNKSKLQPKRML